MRQASNIEAICMRYALIGCGAASFELHAPAFARLLPGAVTAAVDPDPNSAAKVAQALGARAFGSIESCIEEFDAAIVAVPHNLHAPSASLLLRHGKHTLVEKPLATTVEECRDLIALSRDAGCSLAVGHMRRFNPAVELSKSLLDGGLIGRLKHFRIAEGNNFNWPVRSRYLLDAATSGGGVLADTGAHTIDCIRYLVGDLEPTLYADDSSTGVEAECYIEAETSSTARGVIELSRTRELDGVLTLDGEIGSLLVDYRSCEVSLQLRSGIRHTFTASWGSPTPGVSVWKMMAERQLACWHTSLQNKTPHRVVGEDALRVVEIIIKCYAMKRHLVFPWSRYMGK